MAHTPRHGNLNLIHVAASKMMEKVMSTKLIFNVHMHTCISRLYICTHTQNTNIHKPIIVGHEIFVISKCKKKIIILTSHEPQKTVHCKLLLTFHFPGWSLFPPGHIQQVHLHLCWIYLSEFSQYCGISLSHEQKTAILTNRQILPMFF